MTTVHEAIITRGFREVSSKRGYRGDGRQTKYTRDSETLLHADYGPSSRWPNPDANRHVLQYFRSGKKISGGTAWQAILTHHVDTWSIT